MKVRYDGEDNELAEIGDDGEVMATLAPDELEGLVIVEAHRDRDGRLVMDVQSPVHGFEPA